LIQANPEQIGAVGEHLAGVHPDYAAEFEGLVLRAREEAEGVS
jgi:hypothetical protein